MTARANLPRAMFAMQELFRAQAVVGHHCGAASQAPGLIILGLLAFLSAVGVFVLEWEIVYRVFSYLSGGDESRWSPKLMAASSGTVIAAFHILARARPEHALVRLVDSAVGLLIPCYLAGVGLVLAAMLYADGLSELVTAEATSLFADPNAAPTDRWLERLFSGAVSPMAALVFALGIGGIAMCNIFVAHHQLTMGERMLREAGQRLRRARLAKRDLATVLDLQRRYAAKVAELDAIDRRWSEEAIQHGLVNDVLAVIAANLVPHKKWLAERSLTTPDRFAQGDAINASDVAARIAALDAITPDDVLAALKP